MYFLVQSEIKMCGSSNRNRKKKKRVDTITVLNALMQIIRSSLLKLDLICKQISLTDYPL